MPNFQLPNPATQQDIINILTAVLANLPFTPPVVTVVPANPASTTYTYTVVAKMYGLSCPVSTTITTGAASLSAANANAVSWSAFVPPIPAPSTALSALLYDVYRTAGGTTQGKILSNLSPLQLGPLTQTQIAADTTAQLPVGITFNSGSMNALSVVDNGIAGDGTTPPAFNQFGSLYPSLQIAAASGPITISNGTVMITDAAAAALTLGQPTPGVQDGDILTITSTTAYAHTVTTAANGINPSHHVLTFGATAGNWVALQAYQGVWYVVNLLGVTPS